MKSDKKSSTSLRPAMPHHLEQLVEYAEGSVVSRTLLKTGTGTITLFAFDTGQNLSEHSTPFDAFVQVLEGEVELVIGGKSVIAKVGQSVIMPADIPHAVNAVTRFKMLLTMIRGNTAS